ncbi:hypothetical protein EON80_31085, partial [bacterium]
MTLNGSPVSSFLMNSDRFIKQAIVGAVITGWLVSIAIDGYLSISAGRLSETLSDVIKQGLAALVGFLAKTGIDALGSGPVPVTNADGPLPRA